MGSRHRTGRRGERVAERELERAGWRVLDRNWRAGHAELDLVVRRQGVVAFVEVKTRAHDGCGDPLVSITRSKRREVERAAAAWIRQRAASLGGCVEFRFDAVSVWMIPGRRPRCRHLEDAWRIGED